MILRDELCWSKLTPEEREWALERKTMNTWWNVEIGLWPGTRFLAELMQKLGRDVSKLRGELMATKDEILAKVSEQHGQLQSIKVAIDELNGEFNSISEKINDLQTKIDNGQTVDLSELSAKVDEVGSTISELMPAIKANP